MRFKRLRAALAAFRGGPEEKPAEDRYGDDRTYHHSGEVNVEIGPGGHVVAVWFRCRLLPFTESFVNMRRRSEVREIPQSELAGIKAIVFEEKP